MTNQRRILSSRNILLGITGSIAAYKTPDLIRRLRDEEASVTAIMTDASLRFITELSIETASGSRVYSELFDDPMAHVALARDADLLLVAPSTANTVGKFACGLADDLLSTCFLAFTGQVILAPAMNWRMYENPVFRANLEKLKSLGAVEVPPERGSLACGEEGVGRMANMESIVEEVKAALFARDLEGMKVVVTAGPTREYLDGVRFLSNRSSGRMGYAIARVARRRGAEVVLVSGPSFLEPPPGVKVVRVEGAVEMRDAVLEEINGAAVLVMAAAVADFAPAERSGTKLEKSSIKSIELSATPDILAEIGRKKERPFLVGFAAEAGRSIERAREKLAAKGVDVIVYNDVREPGAGFDADTNKVTIIEGSRKTPYPLLAKEEVAGFILDRVSSRRP